MQTKTVARLSRRALLGGTVAGFGLTGGNFALRAETSPTIDLRALSFDGTDVILAAGGLWRSTDGGATWSPLSDHEPDAVTALATHPDRPGRVHAALASGGLMLSQDGGRTWAAQNKGLPTAPVTAITVAATAPDTLYLAIQGDGLWKSEDAGGRWEFVMDRPYLAEAEREVLALASVDLASGMGGIWLYAGTDLGLTRVPDCFCRWQDVQAGDALDALVAGAAPAPERPLPAGEPVVALVSAPQSAGLLYAALASGVWKSTDAGVVWSRVGDADARALAVSPADPNHVIVATRDGTTFSRDGGTTWSAIAAIG